MSHQPILPNNNGYPFVQTHHQPTAVAVQPPPTTPIPLPGGALNFSGSNMMVDEQNSSVADQTNQSQPQSVAGMVPTLQ
jgi:hypothetical protein